MTTSFQLPQLAALVTSWVDRIPTTDANFAVLAEMRTFVAAINGVVAADNKLYRVVAPDNEYEYVPRSHFPERGAPHPKSECVSRGCLMIPEEV